MKTLYKLKQISIEYESLKEEASKEVNRYFEHHNVQDLAIEIKGQNLPKWKKMELKSEEKEEEFIQLARQFGKHHKLNDKELVIKVSEEILQESKSINYFLLVRLMWEVSKEKNSFCLETLENIIRNILQLDNIGCKEEYYLESFIDIWNYDSEKLIPIDILENIILLDTEALRNTYGAMIKAVSYLSSYSEDEVEKVIRKVKMTKKYKEDEYYREWIDFK